MTSALLEPRPWPPRRWAAVLIMVFGLQLGLIFWLSDRSPLRRRLPRPAPVLNYAGPADAELLALTDPTLFALPHPQGFSGQAWMKIPRVEFRSFDWSEPTNWLPVAVQQLGSAFNRFAETNSFSPLPALTLPEPKLMRLEPFSFASLPAQSTWRLQGALARRRLLTPFSVRSWESPELLTNSIVRIVVDAEGKPFSVPILLSSSGSKQADDYALAQCRAARFSPPSGNEPGAASRPQSDLTWGEVIFEWHTVPLALTNAIPVTAPP